MSTICTFLVIIGTYFLGFVTGRMMKGRRSMDYLNPHKIYPNYPDRIDNFPGNDSDRDVKQSLTTAPEWKPPFNWCGEQGAPFDEYGMTYRCYICGRVLQEDSHLCELCVRQHGRKVNV